jgi:hypothetical protein
MKITKIPVPYVLLLLNVLLFANLLLYCCTEIRVEGTFPHNPHFKCES